MRTGGLIVSVVILFCVVGTVALTQSSTEYSIIGGNLNAGGSVSIASTSYETGFTFGQSSPIGVSNSASYQAQMGVPYIYHEMNSRNRLLWVHTAGHATIYQFDDADNNIKQIEYQTSGDWRPVNYSRLLDNTGRLLWKDTSSGNLILSLLNSEDQSLSIVNYNFAFEGWQVVHYDRLTSEGDGILLLFHSAGKVKIQRFNAANQLIHTAEYGPYDSGHWQPINYSLSSDDTGRLLWGHICGTVKIHRFDENDAEIIPWNALPIHGPYNGYLPVNYERIDRNGSGWLLWRHTGGSARLDELDASDQKLNVSTYLPPSDGFKPLNYALAHDGTGRLVWQHPSGNVMLGGKTWPPPSNDGWTPLNFNRSPGRADEIQIGSCSYLLWTK